MSVAYGLTGLVQVGPPPLTGNGPPPASFKGALGQQFFDKSTSPPTQYVYNGATWVTGGNAYATTTTPGIVQLSDDVTADQASETLVPTAKATFDYGQTLVLAGANIASEVVQGIGYVASDAEAVARQANTPGVEAFFLTPTNLDPIFASPSAIGSTTPAAGTFTDFTVTGTVSISSAAPITIDVTGAGNDLTLSSDAGRVIINGEEAAANAITLLSAAGGLDVDVALLASITSTRDNAQAILVEATAGGIDILASGATAGEDIDIIATGSSVNITSTENVATAIVLNASSGGIDITAAGAPAEDIDITNTSGSIILTAGEAAANAISLQASAGGIDVDGIGQINIASSQDAADAMVISSSAGGIDILATGEAAQDIDIINTGGSVNIIATENAAEAIYIRTNGGVSETLRLHADQGTGVASINIGSDVGGVTISSGLASADAINITASNAGGGIDVDSGTAGFIVDTTGSISLDAGAATNLTTSGAGIDITIDATAGRVIIDGGEAAADAVTIAATDVAGGIDIDSGTGGVAIDSTAAFSIDGATASNVTVTGAGQDLTLAATGGSVKINSTEDAAGAIALTANGGTSETITVTASQGTGVASINISSTAGGVTIAGGLATADAINLTAAAGGVDIDGALQVNIASSQDAADAIRLIASAGGIDIDAVGAAGQDIVITNTGGSVSVVATEAVADSIVLSSSAGGIDILAPGAGAGLDIDIVNTGGSVNITATEATANAIVLTASNAAGGIDLTTGGGSVDISSSGFATVVAATDTEASPSATAEINANVGRATFTGFTTAAAGSQVFVITNSIVTTSSCVLVTVCNEGANDAQMTITRVTRGAGSLSVTCVNNGAAALNGNVAVNFWVLTA